MQQPSPVPQYVSDRELAAIYNVSVMTIRRWSKSRRIPAPLRLGENTSRWNLAEVEAALMKAAEEDADKKSPGLAAAHAAYAALDPEVRKAHAVKGGSTKRRRTALREQATAGGDE